MDAGSPGKLCALWRSLPFQKVHFVGQQGLAIAEERDNDAEAYRCFGRRVSNNEEREDLAVDVAENTRERHKVDIDRIQDEFDGHENDDNVAARNHPDGADDEQRKTEEQIVTYG